MDTPLFITNYTVENLIQKLDFVYQPIYNIYTADLMGVQFTIKRYKKLGIENTEQLYHHLSLNNLLYQFFDHLQQKLTSSRSDKLIKKSYIIILKIDYKFLPYFFNLINNSNIYNFCVEISENEINDDLSALKEFKEDPIKKLAVKDFTKGNYTFNIIYHNKADFVKLDSSIFSEIKKDKKKNFFISRLIELAQIMGIKVIVENIKSETDFFISKSINSDYVIGELIHPEIKILDDIPLISEKVERLNRKDKRSNNHNKDFISSHLVKLKPIKYPEQDLEYVFKFFKNNSEINSAPVVNSRKEPLGIIREKDLKSYVYSPYGKELLKNIKRTLLDFIYKAPIAELDYNLEFILEIFTSYHEEDNAPGMIITKNGKYLGLLRPEALLDALNEKNLANARDVNPLSKLPGNRRIMEYLEKISNQNNSHILAYFDFNNFKAFNDNYGFRQGDRVILLFAEMLKKHANDYDFFVGHVGGDDFFVSRKVNEDKEYTTYFQKLRNLSETFNQDVRQFYSKQDKERGYILAKNRKGEEEKFPLLSVSTGVLHLKNSQFAPNEIENMLSELKKTAKKSEYNIAEKTIEN